MHLLGDLRGRLVGVAQFNFDAGDEGSVNPVFGGGAAGLSDDGGEVALREAHPFGIVAYLVVLAAILVHERDEAVEDGLFARQRQEGLIRLSAIATVVVVHQGGDEHVERRMMIVGLMHQLPESFNDVVCSLQISLADGQLEVAHLSIEGRRQLSWCKG